MGNQASGRHRKTTRDHLYAWYQTSLVGRRLRQQIIDELDVQLERLFGYHTLFLGVPPGMSIKDLAHSQTKLVANLDGELVEGAQTVVCTDEGLPFGTESIDTVVVFHALRS